ncbi:MAG: type II toxin-antitoxin system VapC family toxin [Vulcanimicrobiaceae bacterium]
MKFVLDASAAASWTLEDERDDLALAIAENVLAHGAYVPPLFVSEIHNVLLVAVRRKRITPAKAADILTALERLCSATTILTARRQLSWPLRSG